MPCLASSRMERVAAGALATSSSSLRGPRAGFQALVSGVRPRVARREAPVRAVLSARPADSLAGDSKTWMTESGLLTTVETSSEDELHLVQKIHSPAELDKVIAEDPNRLVVLMCKAKSCKPCRMFMRKYRAVAARYSNALFLEVYGDESMELRGLMKAEAVKVTPTFILFRGSRAKLHQHGGIKEANLHDAIQGQLREGEAGRGAYTLVPDADDH